MPASGGAVGIRVGIRSFWRVPLLVSAAWILGSVMALSDVACRAAKPGSRLKKLSDSGGLQLWVQPTGSRLWRLAYRFQGKQKLMALGPYPLVSLAEARAARDTAKKQLMAGEDPCAAKKDRQREAELANDKFKTIAAEWLAKLEREGRAPATIIKKNWLLSLAGPSLGRRRASEIKPTDVLSVLRDVEARGCYETARRLRSTIGCVFRYAIATGRAEVDPTSGLRDAITVPVVTSRAAIIDPAQFGGLLRAIDGFDGQPTTKAALKLMALLFPRPGELRAARWNEFDLMHNIWVVPADRMKMRRPHKSHLPAQAVTVLKVLHQITGQGELVFPGVGAKDRPISENTMNSALRRMGYAQHEMTSHGFRASASTLLNESGEWSADAIERQLAHIESNTTRRAYARGDNWDERVRMMNWWAGYLDRLRAVASVVQLKHAS